MSTDATVSPVPETAAGHCGAPRRQSVLRRAFGTHRATRPAPDDRGLVLIEGLIMMAVIAVVVVAYGALNRGVNQTQRQTQSIDIASQAAQGLMEKIDATPWSKVGVYAGDQGCVNAADCTKGPNGEPTVLIAGAPADNNLLVANSSPALIQNVAVKTRMWVTWVGSSNGNTSATSAAAYGTKRIYVTATWAAPGNGSAERTKTFRFDRTSRLSEAQPVSLAAAATDGLIGVGAVSGGNVKPTPGCPTVTVRQQPDSSYVISWSAVANAQGYLVHDGPKGSTDKLYRDVSASSTLSVSAAASEKDKRWWIAPYASGKYNFECADFAVSDPAAVVPSCPSASGFRNDGSPRNYSLTAATATNTARSELRIASSGQVVQSWGSTPGTAAIAIADLDTNLKIYPYNSYGTVNNNCGVFTTRSVTTNNFNFKGCIAGTPRRDATDGTARKVTWVLKGGQTWGVYHRLVNGDWRLETTTDSNFAFITRTGDPLMVLALDFRYANQAAKNINPFDETCPTVSW